MDKSVALITDGRFLWRQPGSFHGHVAPEAALRGPIAAIEEGDTIEIDIPNCSLNVALSDGEIEKRMQKIAPFQPRVTGGYLGRYVEKVTSASRGAVLA